MQWERWEEVESQNATRLPQTSMRSMQHFRIFGRIGESSRRSSLKLCKKSDGEAPLSARSDCTDETSSCTGASTRTPGVTFASTISLASHVGHDINPSSYDLTRAHEGLDETEETLACKTLEKIAQHEEHPLQKSKAGGKFEMYLSNIDVAPPISRREASRQKLIIFDWDDTLLCSTFLRFRHTGPLPSSVKHSLEQIEKHVMSLLMLASMAGQTFIFTNSETAWVEHSAAKYLPGVLPALEHVNVVSPRSRYQDKYPDHLDMWKTWAFLELQQKLDPSVIKSIVWVGDPALKTKEGACKKGRIVDGAAFKTVHFQDFPTPEELMKQQQRLCKQFEEIIDSAKPLKMRMRLAARSDDKCSSDRI